MKQKVRKRVDVAMLAIRQSAAGLNEHDLQDYCLELAHKVGVLLGESEARETIRGSGGATTSDLLGGAPPVADTSTSVDDVDTSHGGGITST